MIYRFFSTSLEYLGDIWNFENTQNLIKWRFLSEVSNFLELHYFMLKIIFSRPYNLKYIKCQNNSFLYKIMTHMLWLDIVQVIYRFFPTSLEYLGDIWNFENTPNLIKWRFSSEISIFLKLHYFMLKIICVQALQIKIYLMSK